MMTPAIPIPILDSNRSRNPSGNYLIVPNPLIEIAGSANSTIIEASHHDNFLRNKSRSVDSQQQQSSNQLSFPTTLDDLISLNPFKDSPDPEIVPQQPRQHIVLDTDTIPSIAAYYDTTPSELLRVNRLSSRIIFPGQVLKIPKSQCTNQEQKHEPVVQPPVYHRKFIKIRVRHITDGSGVVSGTLLVTPNAVMFDPNVSDPLVLDQGAESFGVILPLDVIVCAGIYSDIAHMRVEGKEYSCNIKPVLYPKQVELEDVSQDVSQDIQNEDNDGDVTLTAVTTENVTPLNDNPAEMVTEEETQPPPLTVPILSSTQPNIQSNTSNIQSNTTQSGTTIESRKTKVLKRLSFPLAWMESLSGAGQGTSGKEESQSAPPESKINYRSLVSLDDMPDLFASFDKLLPFHSSLTHSNQPSSSTTNYPMSSLLDDSSPPWYLCLTTGTPRGKKLKPGLVVSYGQKKSIKPEYWFGVPSSQVEELYQFWMLWWPHLYGELDEKLIYSRGYELVDYETSSEIFRDDEGEQLESLKGELNELTKESWEVVSMSEELRKALYGSGEEYVPELTSVSEILIEEDVKIIARHLSARAEGYPWVLSFSTSRDGFSLNTLYRKMEGLDETPLLLLIQDSQERVFGSLVSTPFRVSDHFYGTGQSFLVRLRPEFQIWKWTGENMYFIKGNSESIAIGAGDGKFGLWLDGDLNIGRSEGCGTYGNPPLVPEKDFIVKTCECWTFGSSSNTPISDVK